MRRGKRVLAGVAAGALGLALVPFVSTSAQAASISGTTSPVRAGVYGTLPAAEIAFAGASSTLTDDDTLVAYLVTAPTLTANLNFDDSAGISIGDTADDSISLSRNNLEITSMTNEIAGFVGANSDDDSTISISVDTAGTYVGGIGNGGDTVTFSFTTTGAPASMTLTPASQTVLVGGIATMTVTLLDAGGNATQPFIQDAVLLTDNSDDTIVTAKTDETAAASLSGSDMSDGTGTIYLQTAGHPAGTTTVTATPAGTLPGLGLTAQTATVTKSGTVTTTSVKQMTVTTPSNAINVVTNAPVTTAQVPSPTTSVTVTIDDSTASTAGNQINLAAVVNRGSVNGVEDDTAYVLVTTDSNKQATATFVLGGTAAVDGGVLTITQVNVLGAATTPAATLTVSVKTPAVNPADVVPTPRGELVALVGATTDVTVQVDDSFGTPISGWVVTAHRGSATGTTVGTGTTDSSGSASLSVSPLSTTAAGQSEEYWFVATNPVLPSSFTVAASQLQVNYETSTDITAMVISPTGNTAGNVSLASPTQTAYPAVNTPSSGTIGDPDSPSGGVYTVSTGLVSTPIDNNVLSFTVSTTPANLVNVTAPEGVKLSATKPTQGVTLWSAGSQTATITGDGQSYLYVWATKTGTHDLTFESGGSTVTAKIYVANKASDAYNIALTPAEQTIGAGAIGTATLTITDVFGNGVKTGSADDSGAVRVTASGEVLLAGFATTKDDITTGADGTATVTFIAGNAAGTGTLAVIPRPTSTTPAWVANYTPPTGAPAPVTSASATVTVSSAPVDQSITISGERGTVRGKSGIIVDGLTTGFDEGAILKPWFKFPGQSSYTEGVKNILVDQDGEFMWQRRTGKKIYISIRSEDGSVKSNRIIIPAK